jgi:hypothetical protein
MKKLRLFAVLAVFAGLLTSIIPTMATEVPVTTSVSGYVSLTFSPDYSSIDFGTVAQSTTDNPALDNTKYHINVTTNGVATITWSEGNLTNDGATIVKANVKITKAVNTPASTNPATATAMGSDVEQAGLADGDQVYANYWVDIPASQTSGDYTGAQTITASAV